MFVILGGFGQQGIAIMWFLLEATDKDIIIIDIKDRPRALKDLFLNENRLSFYAGRDEPIDALNNLVASRGGVYRATVISCLPTQYNLNVAAWCVDRGLNYMDLGEDTDVALEQCKLTAHAKVKESRVVTQCGLAPGIVGCFANHYQSICANYQQKHFRNDLKGVHAYCGGIPERPDLPLGYVRSFHPGGVTKECTGVAQILKDGEVIHIPTLTGRELIHIPGIGVLEAAVTSGGTGTTVYRLKIDFSYKTLRYPGHWDYLARHVLTQPDPASTLELVTKEVSRDNRDHVVLMFELEYESGPTGRIGWQWRYDPVRNMSAMSRATGFIAGAVATMINEELVDTGVSGMDELCLDTIMTKVRNIDKESFLHLKL
jgi:lysine 6-dehydrogenase